MTILATIHDFGWLAFAVHAYQSPAYYIARDSQYRRAETISGEALRLGFLLFAYAANIGVLVGVFWFKGLIPALTVWVMSLAAGRIVLGFGSLAADHDPNGAQSSFIIKPAAATVSALVCLAVRLYFP